MSRRERERESAADSALTAEPDAGHTDHRSQLEPTPRVGRSNQMSHPLAPENFTF